MLGKTPMEGEAPAELCFIVRESSTLTPFPLSLPGRGELLVRSPRDMPFMGMLALLGGRRLRFIKRPSAASRIALESFSPYTRS